MISEHDVISPMSAIISDRLALLFASSLATIIYLRNFNSVSTRKLHFLAFGYTIPTVIFKLNGIVSSIHDFIKNGS